MARFFRGEAPRVVAAGECMLELARKDGVWRLGAGGDSFNTAVYLRRLGAQVRYFTALGLDPFSEEMLQSWQQEGLDVSLVLRDSRRLPGLYAIRTDAQGERSFHYWRQQAAVRQLFRLPDIEAGWQAAAQCDLLYLTGITLSLFETVERQRWVELAARVRKGGGRVAFDPNYRPAGWPDAGTAGAAMIALAPHVDILLTTLDDEAKLWGERDITAVFAHWRDAGAGEVVVKQGAQGCTVQTHAGLQSVRVRRVVRAVDTTGAGDAFNAAYLAARMSGADAAVAARAGHLLAGAVVQVPGAILPIGQMPTLGQSGTPA